MAILLGVVIGILIIYIIYINKNNKLKVKEIENKYKDKSKKEILEELDLNINKIYKEKEKELKIKYDSDATFLETQLEGKRKLIEEYSNQLNRGYELEKEKLEEFKKRELEKINSELQARKDSLDKDFNIEKDKVEKEIEVIRTELENFKEKRESINKAILRERELSEKESFYSIELSKEDLEDMEFLSTISSKINNKAAVNKIIYDVYIKRPLTEMIKRLTAGKVVSGIYKITNKTNGVIYIGKSVDIGKRFTQHIKTALGIGTLANSSFHSYLAANGIQNFTFEILESVASENLTEREKYYINFYESNKYGLNMREG